MSRTDLKQIISLLCPHFGNRPDAWKRAYVTDFEGTIAAQRQLHRAERIGQACTLATARESARRSTESAKVAA